MRIDKIILENFRGFQHLEIDFHPNFNLLVGINGSGKTAVLEALRIAAGALFLDMDKVENKIYSPHILPSDVRLYEWEKQYPTSVTAGGSVLNRPKFFWTRNVEKEGGRTRYERAREMKKVSATIQKLVRSGNGNEVIPLVAFYSIDRFKKETKDMGVESAGSRLRGYFHSLNPKTNLQFFLDLFRTQEFAALQKGSSSAMLQGVGKTVEACIEHCEKVYHHIERDELVVRLKTGEELPFSYLSAGVHIMLAMVMEIAFRCCLLNPSLGEEAPLKTAGIVMIDELDLHLHPSWQKKVVTDLRRAFPKIQFVATTHAPLLIGGMKEGSIFVLKDNQSFTLPSQYGRDANFILLEMETDERLSNVKKLIEDYHLSIQAGKGLTPKGLALRTELESLIGKNDPELQRADVLLTLYS